MAVHVQEMPLLAAARREVPTNRILGGIGMLGSPMLLVEGLLNGFRPVGTTPTTALIQLFFLAGWASTAVGLRQTRAAGDGPLAGLAFLIQITGIALAAVWSGWYLVEPKPDAGSALFQLGDACWPLSVLFWIVV